jgi:hypothetical protein
MHQRICVKKTRYICGRLDMLRIGKSRIVLYAGCSALLFCLQSIKAYAATESSPPYVIRMCILPFYTSASRASLDSDLGPLLEAGLSGNRWLELIPAKKVYEWTYELQPQPWLVRGFWEEGSDARDAEVFFWLRKRLLQKSWARFPADYQTIGRVISTGMRKTLVIEIMESGHSRNAVFTSTQGADRAEGIPEAMTRASAEILDFLEPRWSVRYLEEVRKQYLAQMRSLEGAIRESEEQVKAHPEAAALRVVLLSLYEEDRDRYAGLARNTAVELIRLWEARGEDARRLTERLGVDPFLVLCREQAREEDWSGVEETCRLACERNPLRSAEYDKWRLRASEQLELKEGKKTP